MKDIFLFSTFLFIQSSLFLSLVGGRNRPVHGTHLGLDRSGLDWSKRVCVCVLDGGYPLQCRKGAGENHCCFLFQKACPEQVYIVAVPYALPRKWALLIRLRARQALVTYGLCKPM